MQKQKKRFSRQSTGEMTNAPVEQFKQVKVERKQIPKIPRSPDTRKQLKVKPKQQESVISHLTKRSLFDRKNSHQSDGRPKSLAVKYIGSYKSPRVFGLQDKQFLNLYFNDPFAKCKIDYVLNQNEDKLKRDQVLAANLQTMQGNRSKDTILMSERSIDEKTEGSNTSRTFVKCRSESNLIEASECQRYKQLIVSHSQTYSGCST